MYSQHKTITLFIVFIFACGENKGFDVPGTTNPNNSNNPSNNSDCVDSWTEGQGHWEDPDICASWSEKSESFSLEEGIAYCEGLSAGNIENWSIPSFDDLDRHRTSTPLQSVKARLEKDGIAEVKISRVEHIGEHLLKGIGIYIYIYIYITQCGI